MFLPQIDSNMDDFKVMDKSDEWNWFTDGHHFEQTNKFLLNSVVFNTPMCFSTIRIATPMNQNCWTNNRLVSICQLEVILNGMTRLLLNPVIFSTPKCFYLKLIAIPMCWRWQTKVSNGINLPMGNILNRLTYFYWTLWYSALQNVPPPHSDSHTDGLKLMDESAEWF